MGMASTQESRRSYPIHRSDLTIFTVIPRPCYQPLADGRAVSLHTLGGCVLAEDAGLPAGRDAFYVARDPHVLGLVLLGFPRKSARRLLKMMRTRSLGRAAR